MTLNEIESSIIAQIGTTPDGTPHKLVHSRFDYLDVNASLLLDAVRQIKRTVTALSCGLADPKDHRAEALLLMLLENAYHHGYTPKGK